jgi:peptide/nickel transport system ATP-binding protein
MTSIPALQLHDISVTYPVAAGKKLRALHQLSLAVAAGEVLAIIGESGSGKSTAGRVISRLVAPSAGALLIDGENALLAEPRGPTRQFYRKVQLVFQDPFGSLNPAHTVAHHLIRPLLLHGRATSTTAETVAATLLERCGLKPAAAFLSAYPHRLSGGQRQRVAIARALAPGPRVLVADEPTSMLDLSVRADLLGLLRALADNEGLALVLITHDLAAARLVADRAMVLYAGQVMEEGPAEHVTTNPIHPYTRLLVAAAPRVGGSLHTPLPAHSGHPQVVDPPPGCPFAPRCPHASPPCAAVDPPLRTIAQQTVRCHHPPETA